jgi:predicted HTH transcriptional regulator
LYYIQQNPKTTTSLSQKLNIARITLHRDIDKLKDMGAHKRIGAAKGGIGK